MDKELIKRIRNNSYTYYYLRENSHLYKDLIRNKESINKIEYLAKKRYKKTISDKIIDFTKKIDTLKTIIDVMK